MNKFKIAYTVNGGSTITQPFPHQWGLATFCGSLIEKAQAGQKVVIQAFNGPMALGKHVFNELTSVDE